MNDLNVDQTILKSQKARQMALANILLNEFFKVYTFLILLAIDKELG